MKTIFFITLAILFVFCSQKGLAQNTDSVKRKRYLKELLQVVSPARSGVSPVSYRDKTWVAWQKRTGELPPDFDLMPSLPLLPDPLILEEGTNNIPVKTMDQWKQKKDWIKQQVQHWLSGTFPPAPANLTSKLLSARIENGVKIEVKELRFGPNQQAKLIVEVMTPPGKGTFPVYITQWNHRGWAQIAVRRGYMACIYAGADSKDDTKNYDQIYPAYDFTTLMKRAWGAHRAVDFLYTLPHVNKVQLAISGHSRNGKQALLAGAFDERITAVITSSAGTGGEIPYRYTDDSYDNESIDKISTNFPDWLHPRLRFFTGREHKLPVDQNLLMALIAPRSLLLTSATTESQGNPWGIEQNYLSLQKVYDFLACSQKLDIYLRLGQHATHSRDIETQLDFLDKQFNRKNIPWKNDLYYPYSFENWKTVSGETINPLDYPIIPADKVLLTTASGSKISTSAEWETKKSAIRKQITWLLGNEPSGIKSETAADFSSPGSADYMAGIIGGLILKNGKAHILGPYTAPGDYLNGYLYYPTDTLGKIRLKPNGKLPVVIYLHEFSHATGYAKGIAAYFDALLAKGFAVYSMDMIGFGSRIYEGTLFYDRYPNWSKMGKMVADVRSAIDALSGFKVIDQNNLFINGYSLGGNVGLITAALDDRVSGIAVSSAFNPMRNSGNDGIKSVYQYSHLHGLLPRLGFFMDELNRIPVDYDEIMAAIAPKPLLVISPALDRHSDYQKVKAAVQKASAIYGFLNSPGSLIHQSPVDISRFSLNQQKVVLSWLEGQLE